MNDRLWMYRVSPKGLCKMDYCNRIEGFINYVLSNLSNINRCGIRCPCKKCKNKNVVWSGCCNDASSIKKVHRKILMLVYTRKTICFLWDYGRKDGWVNF